ncbi:4552_t:CDS:2, partial [Paraglomus brasilianum]
MDVETATAKDAIYPDCAGTTTYAHDTSNLSRYDLVSFSTEIFIVNRRAPVWQCKRNIVSYDEPEIVIPNHTGRNIDLDFKWK